MTRSLFASSTHAPHFSRVLWTRLDHSESRFTRTLLREVSRLRRPDFPLCQRRDRSRPARSRREQRKPTQECQRHPQGPAWNEEARSIRAGETRLEIQHRALCRGAQRIGEGRKVRLYWSVCSWGRDSTTRAQGTKAFSAALYIHTNAYSVTLGYAYRGGRDRGKPSSLREANEGR